MIAEHKRILLLHRPIPAQNKPAYLTILYMNLPRDKIYNFFRENDMKMALLPGSMYSERT